MSVFHLAHFRGFVVSQATGGVGRALAAALTFHINLLEARRGYLPPGWDILWSLSVEEMFYLLFPLACRFLGRGRLLTGLLFAFVAIGPFARAKAFDHNPVWREYSYLGGMDAIALGCLTALLVARTRFSLTAVRTFGGTGAALLIFILGFSIRGYVWGLGRNGLNMTLLALGTCMVIVAAAQTQWKAPRLFVPLLKLGRSSYEVYLTHVFVVLGLFTLFLKYGEPMRAVPVLFIVVIVIAALLGEVVARLYSEPMNRLLRKRWGDAPYRLGSVIDTEGPAEGGKHLAA